MKEAIPNDDMSGIYIAVISGNSSCFWQNATATSMMEWCHETTIDENIRENSPITCQGISTDFEVMRRSHEE